MSRSKVRFPLLACGMTTVAMLGAACSTRLVVAPEEVASQIRGQVEQQRGHPVESVTCPSELRGEVGATMRCEIRDAGVTSPATVTVTKVDGNTVNFDLKVG